MKNEKRTFMAFTIHNYFNSTDIYSEDGIPLIAGEELRDDG